MFPACPSEMLKTLWFPDGKYPSQVGNVYDRPVLFQVWSVRVQGLPGDGVLVMKQDRTASLTRQDGKSNRQSVEIHNRMVSMWAESQSRCRDVEG